jgi:hypothetical protein
VIGSLGAARHTVGLLLDYLSDALGWLADWIAGDDWPR